MNVLVEPCAGHITGISDSAEAKICLFGISLWGLENILGTMNSRDGTTTSITALSRTSSGNF